MNVINIEYLNTPYGQLVLGSINNKLCLCDWRYRKSRTTIDERIQREQNAHFRESSSEIITAAGEQLEEYFAGERTGFDLPLELSGSDFQKSVWNELVEIPYGKTTTYLQLSEKLGNTNAIRAVASANGANAIAIIVPCHRVIGSDGELVGYAGGLQAKKKLLQLEGALVNNQYELFS